MAIGHAAPFSRLCPAEDYVSGIQESVKPRLRDQRNCGRDAEAETPTGIFRRLSRGTDCSPGMYGKAEDERRETSRCRSKDLACDNFFSLSS